MPSTLNPNIPGGLEQIIMKAMAHETADRYTTATQMLGDMDEFRKNPVVLFDYNIPPLEAVTKLPKPPLVLETPPSKPTTAERVAREDAPPRRRTETAAPVRKQGSSASRSKQAEHRREQEEEKRSNVATIAIIACSVVMVLAIVVFLVPFATVYGVLSDITGISPALTHQLGYLIPAISLLGVAAAIALRRKGYRKAAFGTQLIGPLLFGLLMLCLFV